MSWSKAKRTRGMRFRHPALASLGFETIQEELDRIEEACDNVHWFLEQDNETLINALDGEEEEAWEFKVAFADLEGKAYQLREAIQDNWMWSEDYQQIFDDCMVALIGNRYEVIAWDTDQEDYYSLTRFDSGLAQTEAGQRLMRLTKKDMLSTIGQCLGTLIAFLDLQQSYDYLKATFDILRDENTSLLQIIKGIDNAYEAANAVHWYGARDEVKQFNSLLDALPERCWIE